MKFNSQICTTRSQSERLLALGLKKDTADYCWSFNIGVYDESRRYTLVLGKCEYMHDIPAWSLHRLIEIAELPQYWECISGNWYEEVIAYIQSMIHINGFNKEYLEEKDETI